MRESRGLREPSGRHLALPGVSRKLSRDPEPELGLEPEEEEKEGLSKRRSLKGKGTELDCSADGRGLREGSRMVREAKSEREFYNLLLF